MKKDLGGETAAAGRRELDWDVEWDGHRVFLPPAGFGRHLDMDRAGVDFAVWDGTTRRVNKLIKTAKTEAGLRRIPREGITTHLHLIPRPDNDYNRWAVSVALPDTFDGDLEKRHLGYLYDQFLRQLGFGSLHALARYSASEIVCSATVYRSYDDAYDTDSEIILDLPRAAVLNEAFIRFYERADVPAVDSTPELHAGSRFATSANRTNTTGGVVRRHEIGRTLPGSVLTEISTFTNDHPPVQSLRYRTVTNGRGKPRSVRLYDADTGRHLGEAAIGLLLLTDERDRDTVLDLLEIEGTLGRLGLRRPRTPHQGVRGTPWETSADRNANRVPNAFTYWALEGLDFRTSVPGRRSEYTTFAQWNPTKKILFVEDQALVGAACAYAARLGVDVDKVQLPKQAWTMDDTIPYPVRRNLDLRPEDYLETRPDRRLYEYVREQLLGDDLLYAAPITWVSDPEPGADVEGRVEAALRQLDESRELFTTFEDLVGDRGQLFTSHDRTGRVVGCRLCPKPAVEFTTSLSTDKLAYCHSCLEAASTGYVTDAEDAAKALALLGELEFGDRPMLESQLAAVHLDPAAPADGHTVDMLLAARMVIRRGEHSWTKLLLEAGLANDGIRLSRGTLMPGADGHLCTSMQEKAVDDFFYAHHIEHTREPLYPFDADLNPNTRRRADWKLRDGTFVEMWGMPGDPVYAMKMVEKQQLAERHGLKLIGLTLADIPQLPVIFAGYLTGRTRSLGAGGWEAPLLRAIKPGSGTGDTRGGNPTNTAIRLERLARCELAVKLQEAGATRQQIADELDAGPETVRMLLRDGKFYRDPTTDPARARLAADAAAARANGVTKGAFRAQRGLSAPRANEVWKDSDVLHA